uniref:glutamate synthase (ferredoxin) n=1 Tax=Schizaphis graminum TaxID=13262 RepID=A0A2S2PKG1_SCHGA
MAAHQEQPVPEQDPWTGPQKDGLYDPQLEKEACGVGFIVAIDGKRTNKIVRDAQKLAMRMNHRGACSCDNDSGDGAGVLTAIPHSFYAHELREQENVDLPEEGKYATGMFYLDKAHHAESEEMFATIGLECKIKVSYRK